MQKTLMALPLIGGLCLGAAIPAGADMPKNVQNAIASAEIARQQANTAKYEWRDTAKLLSQAKAAADKGDESRALALAQHAQLQSEMAIAQAARETTAGPRF